MHDLNSPLNQIQIHYVLGKVLEGLNYLHQNCKIVHHDVRCSNILINLHGSVKLGNFQLAAKNKNSIGNKRYCFIKSPHWTAPEIARCDKSIESICQNFKSDIWSLGKLLF